MTSRTLWPLPLLTCAALLLGACGNDADADDGVGSPVTTQLHPSTTTLESSESLTAPSSEGDCVAPRPLDSLAFAFDGTVISVTGGSDPKAPERDTTTGLASFEVHRWFAGGESEATVEVWMQRTIRVGDRLLVAGQPRWGGEPLSDPIAWECGYTTEHSAAIESDWVAAFAE